VFFSFSSGAVLGVVVCACVRRCLWLRVCAWLERMRRVLGVCLAVSAFVRRWGAARTSQWMVS
ncbi:hypothetical protein BDB00DRAFT_834764, partial [Zychaea mexicana]|uniref:uncharacterized protein n=1 Tax=Zychaea mexicana TaxID=64656 RepID=UPI0022FE47C9